MDRAILLEHLARAEEHVVLAQEHVQQQRDLVTRLQNDGHDTTMARALLEQFERLLVMHADDRDRLAKELGAPLE